MDQLSLKDVEVSDQFFVSDWKSLIKLRKLKIGLLSFIIYEGIQKLFYFIYKVAHFIVEPDNNVLVQRLVVICISILLLTSLLLLLLLLLIKLLILEYKIRVIILWGPVAIIKILQLV